jgi:uncharacterized protein with FMN-binding domain
MPKRGAFALVMTALAVALLLGFRTPEDIAAITGGDQRAAVTGGTGTTGTAGSSGTTGITRLPGTDDGATGGAEPSDGAIATDDGAPSATGDAAPTQARTVTGPVVSTRWGTVQVEITVEDGQLTDVAAIQLPNGDRRSAGISNQVEPMLRSQALSAQSAAIDGVSGATYTSNAYARSLQAALDTAGL